VAMLRPVAGTLQQLTLPDPPCAGERPHVEVLKAAVPAVAEVRLSAYRPLEEGRYGWEYAVE
jgi:hypothetical protein